MAGPDSPRWQDGVQIPKWGTTQRLVLRELRPVLFGSDGRPVQEGEVESNPAGVPNKYRILAFPERRGLQGNESAYKAVLQEFNQILATVSYIRSVILPYGNHTFYDLADVVSTLTSLSDFLVLRSDNPIKNGEIPTEIAGVTKIARGVMKPFDGQSLQETSERYTGVVPLDRRGFVTNASSFMSHILRTNLLLTRESRRDGTACPASLEIIKQVAKVLLEEPAPGMREAGERLGLSDEEILRARDFGRAIRDATLEQQVSTMMRTLYSHQPTVQRALPGSERIIRQSIADANRALKRTK